MFCVTKVLRVLIWGVAKIAPLSVFRWPRKNCYCWEKCFFPFSLKRCLYVRWCELPGSQEKNYLDFQSEIDSPARDWQNRCHLCPRPPATKVFSRSLHQIELVAAVVCQHWSWPLQWYAGVTRTEKVLWGRLQWSLNPSQPILMIFHLIGFC